MATASHARIGSEDLWGVHQMIYYTAAPVPLCFSQSQPRFLNNIFLASGYESEKRKTNYALPYITSKAISYNGWGVFEVTSEARNLDGALAMSDTHLLGDPKGEPR